MTKDTTVSTTAHLLPDGEKDPRLGGNAGMSSDYLEVRGLSVDFGGFKAVRDVDLTLFQGDLRFLIGPNGAGKTTIIDAITGLVPSTGSIQKSGVELVGKKVHQIARLGVGRTFQTASVFEQLTVLQNLQLLMTAPRGLRAWNVLERGEVHAALARLEQVGLRDLAQADAKDLPYGAKKRLELAIALAGLPAQGPRLLLLDEPAAGLAGPERAELMARVTALAREGVAVLYTEHNMDAVFGVADRVLVLIDGLLAASGTPQEVALDATVRSRYLGRGFQAGDVHV